VEPGDRINADLTGSRPNLNGVTAPGVILAITPDEITVRIDSPVNHEDVFVLAPAKVTPAQ